MRFRGQKRPRKGAPKVATHFPSFSDGKLLDSDAFMFIEDVSNSNLQYIIRTAGEDPSFNVTIEAEDGEREKALNLLESLANYNRYNLEELFADALDQVVKDLVYYGRAVCEITRDADTGEIFLHSFTPRRLFLAFRHYVQFIPSGDQELFERKYTFVPNNCIWSLRLPACLGGPNGIRKTIKKLRNYNRFGPKFFSSSLAKGNIDLKFDSTLYERQLRIRVFRTTKNWGWNTRDYNDKFSNEFYRVHRSLTFCWAKAILRDHFICEFNKLLQKLHIIAVISVDGLISPEEILKIRQGVIVGSVPFEDAYDKVILA